MCEQCEQNREQGEKDAWLQIARQALRNLNGSDQGEPIEAKLLRLTVERREAVLALRSFCEDHGDNDWQDDLHMADVINKHLNWASG
jgi:predicted secreted protein